LKNNQSDTFAVIASAAKQSSPSPATPSRKLAMKNTEFRQHRDGARLDCFAFGS
jgi:hypothetical protein